MISIHIFLFKGPEKPIQTVVDVFPNSKNVPALYIIISLINYHRSTKVYMKAIYCKSFKWLIKLA